MSFRKFGRSDDMKVTVDGEDEQGVRKTAARSTWTKRDSEALLRESTEKQSPPNQSSGNSK